MKIILHIGTFKTGSTSLQHHLARNRNFIERHNYSYSHYFGATKAHSNLAYGLLRNALKKYGIYHKYCSHPRFVNVAEKPEMIIKQMVEESGGKDIIISSEALYADAYRTLIGLDAKEQEQSFDRDINAEIRQNLQRLLTQYTDEIIVLCYLRRQDLMIESQFNQLNKVPWYTGGQIEDFEEFVNVEPVHLDYGKELLEWAEYFGEKSIIVKTYEEPLLSYGIIRDFYENILGIFDFEMTKGIPKEETNEGLDPRVIEYKKKLAWHDEKIEKILLKYQSESKTYNKREGYFSHDKRIKFLEKFESSNAVVARHFLNREQLFLEPVENIRMVKGISFDGFVEITRFLLKELRGL